MRYVFECPKCNKVFGVEMNLATYEKHKGEPPCLYAKNKDKNHRMKQLLTPIPFRMR